MKCSIRRSIKKNFILMEMVYTKNSIGFILLTCDEFRNAAKCLTIEEKLLWYGVDCNPNPYFKAIQEKYLENFFKNLNIFKTTHLYRDNEAQKYFLDILDIYHIRNSMFSIKSEFLITNKELFTISLMKKRLFPNFLYFDRKYKIKIKFLKESVRLIEFDPMDGHSIIHIGKEIFMVGKGVFTQVGYSEKDLDEYEIQDYKYLNR